MVSSAASVAAAPAAASAADALNLNYLDHLESCCCRPACALGAEARSQSFQGNDFYGPLSELSKSMIVSVVRMTF